jgi:hypothetical protein
MQKALIVLAAAAGIGLAAPIAATDLQPSGEVIASMAHGLVAEVILGSGVWPYGVSPAPPELQARLLRGSPDCDWETQCGAYGLASTVFPDRQNDAGGEE